MKDAIITEFEDELVQELIILRDEGFELIGASSGNSPYETVEKIYCFSEEILHNRRKYSEDELENISMTLSALWGYAICKEYKWKWKYLQENVDDEKNYYIISPDKHYCCPPFYFIRNILFENNLSGYQPNDNTILLLFNMIKSLPYRENDNELILIS